MGRVIYLCYEVKPKPENEDYQLVGGAYLNCWIMAESISNAKHKAEQFMQESEWEHVSLDESFVAEEELYSDNPETLEYYREAKENGESFVLHVWPPSAQEGETIN